MKWSKYYESLKEGEKMRVDVPKGQVAKLRARTNKVPICFMKISSAICDMFENKTIHGPVQ